MCSMRVGVLAAFLSVLLRGAVAVSATESTKDPLVVVPFCAKPPTIDGKLSPGEWDRAAAVGLMVSNGSGHVCREQAVFYLCWDKKNLHLAMTSDQSRFTDGLRALCAAHDAAEIGHDDCIELMFSPGGIRDVRRPNVPVYYLVLNSLAAVRDTKSFPLRKEDRIDWESGLQTASTTAGARWTCEMRLPWASTSVKPPQEGTSWRLNLIRAYCPTGSSADDWTAWRNGGSLNSAQVGGDLVFSARAPAVRLLGAGGIPSGKLTLPFEVANPTREPQTASLRLDVTGQKADEQTITVPPGRTLPLILGKGEDIKSPCRLSLRATDAGGRPLFFLDRQIALPLPAFAKMPLPKVPPVIVKPRFLPSLDRLAVSVDVQQWLQKSGSGSKTPTASIKVFKKGETAQPVMQGAITEFKDQIGSSYIIPRLGRGGVIADLTRVKEHVGVWRGSTKSLPEGEYVVKVVATNGAQVIMSYDDWFEKRTFDWALYPRGIGEDVPAPFTPLEVVGTEVKPWGRAYQLGTSGMPTRIVSQGKEILAGAVGLDILVDDYPTGADIVEPFAFKEIKPGKVQGRAVLAVEDVQVQVETTVQYDGFMLFRLTYGPNDTGAAPRITRMRVKAPIRADRALFYSAIGDTRATCVAPGLLPAGPGRVYDSSKDTHCAGCSPTFTTSFWVGDHDVCFCYAADSDKGWLIRDDAPAVEAYRDGDQLTLWLNVVDKPWQLKAARTAEFALQAGPTKPLPEGWRGIQEATESAGAPIKFVRASDASTMPGGGGHFIHPGETPEEIERSRAYLARFAGSDKLVEGYNYWHYVPLGFAATRVYRSEWGLTQEVYNTPPESQRWFARLWRNRVFGENKQRYCIIPTNGAPSYVDFLTEAWDRALAKTPIAGVYDDNGFPKPNFDEELGMGFVREDGRKVASSGTWSYRERWKRAQYVQAKHGRFNALSDEQCCCWGHILPGESFLGFWRPCEIGYYNYDKNRDNIDFYGSLEGYAAYNPARQMGMIPEGIGMASPQTGEKLASDSRGMCLLAFLHDQNVGSNSNSEVGERRDAKVIAELTRAKNRFRQWEKGVDFVGYWESERCVRSSDKDVRISLYTHPERAMLFLGNVGKGLSDATVTPNWKALNLNPKQLVVTNAESGDRIPLESDAIEIAVPRHDLRILLVSPAP